MPREHHEAGGNGFLLLCGACDSRDLEWIGAMPLRTRDGILDDIIYRCRQCGTYMRKADFADPRVQTHFDVSSYTDPQNETQILRAREGFFRYLIELAEHHWDRPAGHARLLDIGASYGHLIGLFRKRGATCTAIEVSECARAALQKKNIDTLTSIEALPADARFDVITVIDSLYYLPDPGRALRQLRPHLEPGGIMILRLANRTPFLNFLRAARRPITETVFGDAKINFSYRGVCTLMETSGYRVVAVILRERGKRARTRVRLLYYKLSLPVSRLLGIKLTPGIILVCRRIDQDPAPSFSGREEMTDAMNKP